MILRGVVLHHGETLTQGCGNLFAVCRCFSVDPPASRLRVTPTGGSNVLTRLGVQRQQEVYMLRRWQKRFILRVVGQQSLFCVLFLRVVGKRSTTSISTAHVLSTICFLLRSPIPDRNLAALGLDAPQGIGSGCV